MEGSCEYFKYVVADRGWSSSLGVGPDTVAVQYLVVLQPTCVNSDIISGIVVLLSVAQTEDSGYNLCTL